MSEELVTLDVREDIRGGREPFGRIMQAVSVLGPGQGLRLIAPLEPVPLFAVMARKGYGHQAKEVEPGTWEVVFTPDAAAFASAPVVSPPPPPTGNQCGGNVVEVDARGLEPPQPMVTILEALAALPAGAQLRARTDRRPMHLYAHLEERGFVGETAAQPDGSYVTHIRAR